MESEPEPITLSVFPEAATAVPPYLVADEIAEPSETRVPAKAACRNGGSWISSGNPEFRWIDVVYEVKTGTAVQFSTEATHLCTPHLVYAVKPISDVTRMPDFRKLRSGTAQFYA
jgi:hypothetical protein